MYNFEVLPYPISLQIFSFLTEESWKNKCHKLEKEIQLKNEEILRLQNQIEDFKHKEEENKKLRFHMENLTSYITTFRAM